MTLDRIDLAPAEAQLDEHEASASIFYERESAVRSYSRSFPTIFTKARGALVHDVHGRSYIDFFAGAGALNYGHNHPAMKAALVEYVMDDGLAHGLDLFTGAKRNFLERFTEQILRPRGLDHRVQFVGPTGTNAVEAALKVARKATGRHGVIAFMGGYHGHSLGSLAATGNKEHRAGAGVPLAGVTFVPFPSLTGPLSSIDTLAYLRHVLSDTHSGVEVPAAILVETVQAEGGVNVASITWLRELRRICDEFEILLIVDEIQTGCGRTGTFFSFERADIVPDIITVSKSISGYGLPMALTLIRPEFDCWLPGEHTGTFRGNQHAFVTAAVAIDLYATPAFEALARRNAEVTHEALSELSAIDERIALRGLGMLWGLDLSLVDPSGGLASSVSRECFSNGLIIETAGSHSSVLKFLAPLNIEPDELDLGLSILGGALKAHLS